MKRMRQRVMVVEKLAVGEKEDEVAAGGEERTGEGRRAERRRCRRRRHFSNMTLWGEKSRKEKRRFFLVQSRGRKLSLYDHGHFSTSLLDVTGNEGRISASLGRNWVDLASSSSASGQNRISSALPVLVLIC